jgi:hypothetical protein
MSARPQSGRSLMETLGIVLIVLGLATGAICKIWILALAVSEGPESVLSLFIPFVNIWMGFRVGIDVAHSFGKSTGFGIGLVILAPIFYMILGFGSAEYLGPANERA